MSFCPLTQTQPWTQRGKSSKGSQVWPTGRRAQEVTTHATNTEAALVELLFWVTVQGQELHQHHLT